MKKNKLMYVALLAIGLVGCGKDKLTLPEWATESKPAKEIDVKTYFPVSSRKVYTKEEVKKTYGEYVYLLNNFGEYDKEKNPNYYGRLYNMAWEGLNIGTYETTIQLVDKLKKLDPETIMFYRIRNDKEHIKTKADYKYETMLAPLKVVALYKMGKKDEALKLYNDVVKEHIKDTYTWYAHPIAAILDEEGNTEETEKIHNEIVNYEGKKYPSMNAASALETCLYYYKKGNYDKVISTADIFLSIGESVEDAHKILDHRKGKISEYFTSFWTSTYPLLLKFKVLAENAKKGEVIDINNLKDGIYNHSNISFKGVPFNVTLTIEEGKMKSIEAVQNPKDGEVLDDRPFGAKDLMIERIMKSSDYGVDSIASATISSTSIRLGVMEGLIEASKK